MQGEWIVKMMLHMKESGKVRIEAGTDEEDQWAKDVVTIANTSLLPNAKSVSPRQVTVLQ
jgi:hypothetical protein